MLRESYPYDLAGAPEAPNQDLETDQEQGRQHDASDHCRNPCPCPQFVSELDELGRRKRYDPTIAQTLKHLLETPLQLLCDRDTDGHQDPGRHGCPLRRRKRR